MPGSIWVLTGPKNSGKSTFCRDLASAARRAGADVAGICTERRRGPLQYPDGRPMERPLDPHERDQLMVTDLRGGSQALLGFGQSGRWHLLDDGFALGRRALAAATPCDLLVVDEIGRLELWKGSGWIEVFQVLAGGSYRQAVVTLRQGGVAAFRQALGRAAPAGRSPRFHVHALKGPYPSIESASLQQELLSLLAGLPREAVVQR